MMNHVYKERFPKVGGGYVFLTATYDREVA